MLEAAFGRQKMESTLLSGFQSSRAARPLLKMLNAQDVQQQAKQMNMWNKQRNSSSKTKEPIAMKF
jgi:GH24 family phage-related lysozyme (muramidase)